MENLAVAFVGNLGYISRMNPPLLVISPTLTREALCQAPFHLDPADVFLCSPASLRFISVQRFAAVVLHEIAEDILVKVGQGIHDNDATEGLWEVLRHDGRPVWMLVSAPIRSPESWRNLGIEPVTPADLLTAVSERLPTRSDPSEKRSPMLTADDIHEMQRRGEMVLPADVRMTPWASEVADSLGLIRQEPGGEISLVDLGRVTRSGLRECSASIFSWQSRWPALLFVLPPVYFPVFQELFPALRGRLVSPTIHWEEKGAFTGELSASMLADFGCAGALIPEQTPYLLPKNLEKIRLAAKKRGLLLFRRIPLEHGREYDIMATPYRNDTGVPLAVWTPATGNEKDSGKSARLYSGEALEKQWAGEGREK
jgi:hypothetical protein